MALHKITWQGVLVRFLIALALVFTTYVRATMRSLGLFGLILAVAFFGVLLWLAIDFIPSLVEDTKMVIDLVLVLLAGILATGITWSHIRRRVTGQADVDDVDA